MTHMELAAGVGQHRTGIKLGFGLSGGIECAFGDTISVTGIPVCVGQFFNNSGEVAFLHDDSQKRWGR